MKTKRTAPLAAAMAIAALLATPLVSAQNISDDKVVIGVLSDMSGLYSDTAGEGSVVAARMAIEDFGGKVRGKPIELVTGDHQNKADVGAGLARNWFERGGVDAIVDLNQSAVGMAVNALVRENGKVALNTGAVASSLTNEGCAPTAIHWTYDTYAMAYGAARGVSELGAKTWFMLTVDYTFGHAFEANMTEFVTGLGGKVVGRVSHPMGTSDMSSFILQAQASKADAIALANATTDTTNAIKTARQFGVTGKQRVVPLLILLPDVHALGLEEAQGMTFATAFYWDRTPETRAWSRRFFEHRKRMPTQVHAGTYSAVTHYLKAIEAAGTDTGSDVVAKMREIPVNDMFAANGSIREDGRMIHDMYLVQVKAPAESKQEWDYYHVLGTIPGEDAFQSLEKSKCPLLKR